jgi:dihydrofolate reductase
MRKLIYGINLTLDGCCDHTKQMANEEIHDYFTKLLHEADTLIYGRITYQLMVPFWPDMAKNLSAPTKSMNDFAQAFDSINQIVVFSKTLGKPEGNKTRIVGANLQDEIIKLKEEQGKNIIVGGVDIPSQLIQLGLVDEYHFVIHPIFAGEGRRLLDRTALQERSQLELAESKILKSGHVALRLLKN